MSNPMDGRPAPAPDAPCEDTVVLTLVSHTNVGKTTLARTLLQREVGEVRDAAHVTQQVQQHQMLATDDGARLALWDTPGFGDSLRLAQRLAAVGNPLGWFLTEVWDRFRDRSFWLSQRTLRHVMAHTDVVLYLVDASQDPAEAGHLGPELQVLELVGKPVLVLLNQLGPPLPPDRQREEVERWRTLCAAHPVVRDVIPLDAFARCWVQEGTLLDRVVDALPPTRRATMQRLRLAWRDRQRGIWRQAMALLAERLAAAATDHEPLDGEPWRQRLQSVGAGVARLIGRTGDSAASPAQRGLQRLAERLDCQLRDNTNRLIALHGLHGEAGRQVLDDLAAQASQRAPIDEGKAAVLGGVVAGALVGLKADVASGGLTLGGGLLAGGVLGALGALGVARGVNKVQGLNAPSVAWTEPVLDELLRGALLGYLAVVHFGRGRGDWTEADRPAHWGDAVDATLARHAAERSALWARRPLGRGADAGGGPANAVARWQADAATLLARLSADLLGELYPQADRPQP